ncbi:protein of unknown function [Pseudodesulfovibrio profundus]|uniref:Uncharacterized protein n=1 Tax=Pseudodesulfovibrio profundus TaxID=57320 RepID=A0A2C8F8Y6_9BACT|nr:protein of unknown function [Pseudodesulfovibrio profundus]
MHWIHRPSDRKKTPPLDASCTFSMTHPKPDCILKVETNFTILVEIWLIFATLVRKIFNGLI